MANWQIAQQLSAHKLVAGGVASEVILEFSISSMLSQIMRKSANCSRISAITPFARSRRRDIVMMGRRARLSFSID